MNHDATHCLDWDRDKCPKICYRAELTADLEDPEARDLLIGIPLSYAHYHGTDECELTRPKKTGAAA